MHLLLHTSCPTCTGRTLSWAGKRMCHISQFCQEVMIFQVLTALLMRSFCSLRHHQKGRSSSWMTTAATQSHPVGMELLDPRVLLDTGVYKVWFWMCVWFFFLNHVATFLLGPNLWQDLICWSNATEVISQDKINDLTMMLAFSNALSLSWKAEGCFFFFFFRWGLGFVLAWISEPATPALHCSLTWGLIWAND